MATGKVDHFPFYILQECFCDVKLSSHCHTWSVAAHESPHIAASHSLYAISKKACSITCTFTIQHLRFQRLLNRVVQCHPFHNFFQFLVGYLFNLPCQSNHTKHHLNTENTTRQNSPSRNAPPFLSHCL